MGSQGILKHFSGIKYIYDRESTAEVNLATFVDAVVKGISLEINRKQLENIFVKDLSINLKDLDNRLCKVLCEALIYYMSVWPGWQRKDEYHGDELQSKELLERFRQYLTFKSNFIVKNSTLYLEQQDESIPSMCDKETQTTSTGQKEIAPYTLEIGGPPRILNNIVFLDYRGSILMKQHLEIPWHNLKLHEFLNWPYVSANVKLPDISISRSNVHRVERFLALQGDQPTCPDVNHIIHITKMSDVHESDITPYSSRFFFFYFRQANKVLSRIPNIDKQKLNEIAIIFAEFVKDVKEMNIFNSTMSPHVTVGFNIGRCRFIRHKQMVSSAVGKITSHSPVNFCEILIPQVDISLNYFHAVQDCSNLNRVTFISLNSLLKKLLNDPTNSDIEQLKSLINNSCITYGCNLCKENFSGPNAYETASEHFKNLHKSEQSVLCYKCGRIFLVSTLAGKRWSHKCNSK